MEQHIKKVVIFIPTKKRHEEDLKAKKKQIGTIEKMKKVTKIIQGVEKEEQMKEIECNECRRAGFWWKQKCSLEVGAKFSEPEKVICPECKGTGKIKEEALN